MNTNTENSSMSEDFQTLFAKYQPLLSIKQQQKVESLVLDYRDIVAKTKSLFGNESRLLLGEILSMRRWLIPRGKDKQLGTSSQIKVNKWQWQKMLSF